MQWLVKHPEYLENQLVIGGEGYSGIIAPALVRTIIDGITSVILKYIKKIMKFVI